MKNYHLIFSVLVFALFLNACKTEKKKSENNDFLVLKNRYLGQKTPGLIPEVFATGIISTKGWEYGVTFTPDMKEIYFIREIEVDGKYKQEFVVYKFKNKQWEESVISPRVGQAFFSVDGKTMHLGKRYKERTETGWSEIKNLGSPFEDIRIMRLTVSAKGTYYFDEAGSDDGDGVIRYSRLIDGKREEPIALSKEINTGKYNAHPFIAPDESYIIWDG